MALSPGSTDPPLILVQPQSQTVGLGQSATLSLTATGANLHFQWRKNNDGDIAGATGFSYVTPALNTGDNGSVYSCVVSNPAGSIVSSSALLTVTSDPVSTQLPVQSGFGKFVNQITPENNQPVPIQFDLAQSENVNLSIYTLQGQVVKTLWDGPIAAGFGNVIPWDGTNRHHEKVASGVYLVLLKTSGSVLSTKIVVIR
jgi:hypothetical protein